MTSREPRIPFKVVECSSFDEQCSSARALEHVHPQSQGWISARWCSYPQQLTLELERPARIQQIQILSHEFLISTRIELFIGCQSGSFTRLGYTSLDPNIRSAYKARELKTVDLQIHSETRFLRLVIHKNHENDANTFSQVGLIAVNILGERVDRKNPADLSTDVECDPHTARLLRALHEEKRKAVEEEDFDRAKELKGAIESLRAIGIQLAKLEAEKVIAVQREDYDLAKTIKMKMDKIRQQHSNQQTAIVSVLPGNECRASSPAKVAVSAASLQVQPGHSVKQSPEKSPRSMAYDERPLPAQHKHHEPTDPVHPFGDRGATNSQVAETSDAVDNADLSISEPVPLSEPEKVQYASLIAAFGESVVTLLLSKKAFQHRINALDEIEGIVTGSISGNQINIDLVKNALSAVAIALPDGLCQVSVRAMCLIDTLVNKAFQHLDRNDIETCMDPIMPTLLSLLDNSTGRQRDKARHIFDLLVHYPSVIGRFVTKPLKTSDAYKPLQGRVELLTVLIEEHGLYEENGLRLDQIMHNFAVPALRHKRSSVRQAGIDLTVALHNHVGDDVLLNYLEGVVNAKLEATLRKTFLEKQLLQNQHQSNASTHSSQSMAPSFSHSSVNNWRNSPSQRHRESENGVFSTAADNGGHHKDFYSSSPKNSDDIDDESICRFCGKHDPEFTQEEALDMHYWMHCPMLVSCKLCEQVVEIPTLVDHLLNECERSQDVYLCKGCKRPLCGPEEIDGHESSCPGPQSEIGDHNQCPLCFSIIGPGEDGWREHLLEGSGCPANSRQTLS